MSQMIAPGQALRLSDLVVPTPDGIASRVLGKTSGGNLTLFAFDAGQCATEHWLRAIAAISSASRLTQ